MTQTTEQVGQSEEESYMQKRKSADDYYRAPSQWKNILKISDWWSTKIDDSSKVAVSSKMSVEKRLEGPRRD